MKCRMLLLSVLGLAFAASASRAQVLVPAAPVAPVAPVAPATGQLGYGSDFFQDAAPPPAKLGGQVFFRGGAGFLTESNRGNGFYTDGGGVAGLNDGTSGFGMGFGLDIPLMKDPWWGNTLLGEVLIDYAQFSRMRVRQTVSPLLPAGTPLLSEVSVSQLAIVGAPKYRFEGLGRLRPWVIPVGMAFFVNNPPTNDSTYLDVGLHFGAGVEYLLTPNVSLGADVRYNKSFNLTNSPAGDFLTAGVYLGFNF